MAESEPARRHDQAAIRPACKFRDPAFDLARVTHVNWAHLHSQKRSHGLNSTKLTPAGGEGWIARHVGASYMGRDLLQQFKPFPAHAVFKHRKAGRIAAGVRQTRNKAPAHWIGRIHKHDWHGTGSSKERS